MALLALAGALAMVPDAGLAQTKTGTTTAQFLLIEPSARIAGMGNAGAALFDGISSVYYNTAGLGHIDRWSVQVTHSAWLADIAYNYAALAVPVKGVGTFFVGLTSLNSGDIDVRTVEQPLGTGERFDVSDLAIALGYGRRLTSRVAAGFQVNYVEETIWNTSMRTVTFNVGTIYTVTDLGLQIGSSLSNYGTSGRFSGRDLRIQYDADETRYGDNSSLPAEQFTEDFAVPVLFRVGLSLPRQITQRSRVLCAVDALHPSDSTEGVNLGAEWLWRSALGLRAGYQDLGQDDSEVGLTLGAGLQGGVDGYDFGFDYAWADHGRLEETHRMTFAVIF